MKNIWRQSIAIGVFTVATLGIVTTSAATWTITTNKVSDHGKWSSYGRPNLKTTYHKIASFNGDSLPNAYGYRVWLMNSNAQQRSTPAPLVHNKSTYASEWRMVAKNIYYYADPRSASYEPNNSHVTFHFSADRK